MRLAARYIGRQILVKTSIVSGVFIFIGILVGPLLLLRLITHNGVDLITFGYFVLLSLPKILTFILPFAIFFAFSWAFWRLADDKEIIILRVSGLSDWVLLRSPLLCSVLVSLILYIFLLYVNPMAREQITRLQLSAQSEFALSLIRPGRFNRMSDITLYVGTMDSGYRMRDIFLYNGAADNIDADIDVNWHTIIAEDGQLFNDDDGIGVVVRNGSQQILQDGRLHHLSFDEYTINLAQNSLGLFGRARKADERSVHDLIAALSAAESYPQSERAELWAELHNRLTYPLSVPLFGLLGFYMMLRAHAERPVRRGVGLARLAAYFSHPPVLCLLGFLLTVFFMLGDYLLVRMLERRPELWPWLYLFFIVPMGGLLFLPAWHSRGRR